MRRAILGSSLVAALLTGSAAVAAELQSGPPVGSGAIPAFNPLHATGPYADKKLCLV